MAGGAIVNTAGGKDYPGKLTLFVFFTCVVAATGGLIFGYDIGISGQLLSCCLLNCCFSSTSISISSSPASFSLACSIPCMVQAA